MLTVRLWIRGRVQWQAGTGGGVGVSGGSASVMLPLAHQEAGLEMLATGGGQAGGLGCTLSFNIDLSSAGDCTVVVLLD